MRSVLSQTEIEALLQNYLQGKSMVEEAELLTLCAWANRVQGEHVLLTMMLAGQVVPVLINGEIGAALPADSGGAREAAS